MTDIRDDYVDMDWGVGYQNLGRPEPPPPPPPPPPPLLLSLPTSLPLQAYRAP